MKEGKETRNTQIRRIEYTFKEVNIVNKKHSSEKECGEGGMKMY